MQATTRQVGGNTVVTIEGGIDTAEVGAFRTLLEEAVAMGTGRLVLEAAKLSYLNSAAVGVLAAVQRTLKESDRGALVIYHPQSTILRLLRITRLDTVLEVVRQEPTEAGPS